jgi:oxalate decarboxylase/phosphoglucose isomerase-like protein (cupin superfamily)
VGGTAALSEGLVLQDGEGERRVRRNAAKGPFILKVDRQNGASPDLVMGYEDLAPGAEIQAHTHLVADEILFVHRGSGVAFLGKRESPVTAGATIYIPRNVMISVRNTGSEPLGIAFIFSKPGFEQLMRENSVLEGQPVTPISAEERAQIRERHRWHTVFPP